MKYSFLFLILFSNSVLSQTKDDPHGTLIVAVSCNDGIILAVDTRITYHFRDSITKIDTFYAYIDGFNKIYKLGNFQLAIEGYGNIGNDLWPSIVKKYNTLYKPDSTVWVTLGRFKDYLFTNTEITEEYFRHCKIYLVGYEDKVPVMVVADSLSYPGAIETKGIGNLYHSNTCFRMPIKGFTESSFSIKNIMPLLKKGFKDCSDKLIYIGNSINIVKVNANNTDTRLTKVPFLAVKDKKDLSNRVLNNQLRVVYIYPFSKDLLRLTLLNSLKSTQ